MNYNFTKKNANLNGLSEWIYPPYLDSKIIQSLRKTFKKNKPYSNIELVNFLRPEQARKLLLALTKEKFYTKESDLFQFSQTKDLAGTGDKDLLKFRNFLCSEGFIFFMENLTGFRLKTGRIDLAGTLYKDTDFLLCHDDQLEGRKIAFLLYFSDFEADDGGSLLLHGKEFSYSKKIIPRFNKFAFFEVSKISYHEISEVIADKQRIALGGWFHGK